MSNPNTTPSPLDDIYRELLRGAGHEKVTDDNVQSLIEMAASRGDRVLEVELREWQAPCAPDVDPEEILRSTSRPGRPAVGRSV